MKVISSRQTFFIKKIFPAIWLGFLGVFPVISMTTGASRNVPLQELLPFLVMPVIMVIFGIVLFRKLVWDLADEVSDGGDFLLVRKAGIEERIRLADVMNVSMGISSRPPRLSLRLRKPGKLGDEVVFVPAREFTLNPFARNMIAEDLIRRVDAARSRN